MNSKDIKVHITDLNPSNNISPEILKHQYTYRTTKNFVGKSEIAIGNMLEPIWWNRILPDKADNTLLKNASNGIYSYEFPLLDSIPKWKANYNILLNTNSMPVAIHINSATPFTVKEKTLLGQLIYKNLIATLADFNIPEDAVYAFNNDLFINQKKFFGGEKIATENVYEEDVIITFNYNTDKILFDQLTYGKSTAHWPITGILDEFPGAFTKEDFLQHFQDNIKTYLKQLDI